MALDCSLAQPDLIYKFMGLAAHGQMLNTQAGLSLGLGSIAAKAQAELAPHLPKLIPKLYRYQFEPTIKVQQAMRGMWNALVPDTKLAIEEHFDAIMQELLPSMGARQWYVRSCGALRRARLCLGTCQWAGDDDLARVGLQGRARGGIDRAGRPHQRPPTACGETVPRGDVEDDPAGA